MKYAKINKAGAIAKYPYSLTDLQRDFPDTSVSRDMERNAAHSEFSIVRVEATERPASTDTSRVREGTPAFDGKVWKQTWVVEDVTAEIEAEKDREAEAEFERPIVQEVFQLRNELRELKGQPPLTKKQFIARLRKPDARP
jgi:hypothetical protein